MTMSYFLSRSCPLDTWRIVTERPTEGEVIELDVQFYGQAIAERDRANGLVAGEQGSLEL